MPAMRYLIPAILAAQPVWADDAFVESNVLAIFYHELGHALIDVEEIPIFGQEEDAADVLSIFLIDAFFDEETAQAIAADTAYGFAGEAEARGDEVHWWDIHGPDEQRYYNTICVFYGADPDSRADLAQELGLPEERAETCAEEYDQAAHAWGSILDRLAARGPGTSLTMVGDGSLASQILVQEIDSINAEFTLAQPIEVTVESCGEANAFYDPTQRQIIFCAEFEGALREMADRL